MHNPTYRVISILEAVSNNPIGYTLSELTKITGIPVGTISPILKTLLKCRLLEFDHSNNKYTIGINSYYIGLSFSSKNSILDLVRQEMKVLSEECTETCQLGILKKGQIFYLLKVEGKDPIRLISEVGGTLPAYATGLGKAILSKYSDEEIDEMYSDGLTSLTTNTIEDIDVLKNQLNEIRVSGFARECGESTDYSTCIAVPIFQNGDIVAGLSVVYPIFRDSEEKKRLIETSLVQCKSNIEKILLGHNLL